MKQAPSDESECDRCDFKKMRLKVERLRSRTQNHVLEVQRMHNMTEAVTSLAIAPDESCL